MKGYMVLSLKRIIKLESELLEKREDSFNGLSTTVIIHIKAEESKFNDGGGRSQFSIEKVL